MLVNQISFLRPVFSFVEDLTKSGPRAAISKGAINSFLPAKAAKYFGGHFDLSQNSYDIKGNMQNIGNLFLILSIKALNIYSSYRGIMLTGEAIESMTANVNIKGSNNEISSSLGFLMGLDILSTVANTILNNRLEQNISNQNHKETNDKLLNQEHFIQNATLTKANKQENNAKTKTDKLELVLDDSLELAQSNKKEGKINKKDKKEGKVNKKDKKEENNSKGENNSKRENNRSNNFVNQGYNERSYEDTNKIVLTISSGLDATAKFVAGAYTTLKVASHFASPTTIISTLATASVGIFTYTKFFNQHNDELENLQKDFSAITTDTANKVNNLVENYESITPYISANKGAIKDIQAKYVDESQLKAEALKKKIASAEMKQSIGRAVFIKLKDLGMPMIFAFGKDYASAPVLMSLFSGIKSIWDSVTIYTDNKKRASNVDVQSTVYETRDRITDKAKTLSSPEIDIHNENTIILEDINIKNAENNQSIVKTKGKITIDLPEPGKILAFTANNGVGKSLIAKFLSNVLPNASGKVSLPQSNKEGQGEMIYIPANVDNFLLDNYTLYDTVKLLKNDTISKEEFEIKFKKLAQEIGFNIDEEDDIFARTAWSSGKYKGMSSSGEKQMVALILAIIASPRILVVDETLANVDQEKRPRILEQLSILSSTGTSVILVDHPMFGSETLPHGKDGVVNLDRNGCEQYQNYDIWELNRDKDNKDLEVAAELSFQKLQIVEGQKIVNSPVDKSWVDTVQVEKKTKKSKKNKEEENFSFADSIIDQRTNNDEPRVISSLSLA